MRNRALGRVAELKFRCAIIVSLTGLNTDEERSRIATFEIGQAHGLCAVGLHFARCFGQMMCSPSPAPVDHKPASQRYCCISSISYAFRLGDIGCWASHRAGSPCIYSSRHNTKISAIYSICPLFISFLASTLISSLSYFSLSFRGLDFDS